MAFEVPQVVDRSAVMGRVKVDLSEFFHDERKSCFKCLDFKAMRKVQDLKRFLTSEMGISEQVNLMLGDYILMDTDNIAVLRDGELIRVKKCGRMMGETHSPVPTRNENRASPNKVDRCSRSGLTNGRHEVNRRVVETRPESRSSSSERESSIENKPPVAPAPNHEVENLSNELLEESLEWMKEPLPKRKRIRKRRGRRGNGSESAEPEEMEVVQEAKPVRPFRPPRCAANDSIDRKHIRFDGFIPTTEQPTANSHSHREPSSNSISNGATLDDILAPQQPIVFKRSRPLSRPVKPEKNIYQSMTDQQLFDLPPATERPKIDTVVAYRTLFVGENYTPELSGWLVARVVSDNPEGLGLQLLSGSNPFFITGENKFEVEEMVSEEREDFMTVAFEDLAMTRLVSPSNSISAE